MNAVNILEQSLCLLPGVSPEAEIRLRRAGVLTCRQLADEAPRHFSPARAERIRAALPALDTALRCRLLPWFVAHLPPGHRVRVLRAFPEAAAFFDIETDGFARAAHVTCISVWHAGHLRSFVRGRTLHRFLAEWTHDAIWVGFNSKRFDTPVVAAEFGLAGLPPQIDLMDEAAHWGFRGGLKAIEPLVGFFRPPSPCANGADAIEFWRAWTTSQDKSALRALLHYNRLDVLSLRHLAARILRLSTENLRLFDN